MTRNEIQKRYRERHPDRVRGSYMKWKRRRFFGLSQSDYDSMLAAQGGVCAVCNEPERRRRQDGSLRALVVDHDHTTGQVRALLCARCNSALSVLESPEFAALKNYLTMWKRTA